MEKTSNTLLAAALIGILDALNWKSKTLISGCAQDLTLHRAEVHAKLVAIMRERLNANLKQLPAVADAWAGLPSPSTLPPPSAFALANAKQLRILGQACPEPQALSQSPELKP